MANQTKSHINQTHLTLSDEQKDWVREYGKRTFRSDSDVIRYAIALLRKWVDGKDNPKDETKGS